MTEADVTLTDYGLAILCSWFAWSLWRHNSQAHQLQKSWFVFFASIAAASLIGGTVHGFFSDESTLGYQLLWRITVLAIGVTAATAWVITGLLISSPRRLKAWVLFAAIAFALYAVTVIFYSQQFTVVVLNYLPPMIALLIAAARRYTQTHSRCFLLIAGGILISLVAAFVQQAGISIHSVYFNHNATYHLIQAVGLWVLFKGSAGLLTLKRTS